jgi:transposase
MTLPNTPNARFRLYNREQLSFLPIDMREWLPQDHLVYFILDTVDALDLSAIVSCYHNRKDGGQPPYHPSMMTSLLLYAYSTGNPSSRKIERATYESVAYRVLTADQHPDHDTIAEFRRYHLDALAGLFVQVLRLCQGMGMVQLGHVALDGTKVRANASKHKAMSYARIEKSEAELESEVLRLLSEAERQDGEDDALYDKGRRGESLPEELRRRTTRLAKIREAKRALEQEARAKAEAERAEYEKKKRAHEERNGRGSAPKPPCDKPAAKAQRNFTDPDSRIMKDGATKSFEQCYNAQVAVDATAQVIVACAVTQEANDKEQVKPMIEKIKSNTGGKKPRKMSADSGFYSETNLETLAKEEIDAYIATDRQKHDEKIPSAPRGRIPEDLSVKARMARKLRTVKGRATYSKRKIIVEPAFGQIKDARGFRRFSLRGLLGVTREWDLICLTHNLLKVFRHAWRPQTT